MILFCLFNYIMDNIKEYLTQKNIIIALIVVIVAYLLWKNLYSQEHLTPIEQIQAFFGFYKPKVVREPKEEQSTREENESMEEETESKRY